MDANNTAFDFAKFYHDEWIKVFNSFEYFLDTYVYIEDKESNRAIKLQLWPAQRKVINDLIDENLLILLKTRQVGLTWLDAAAECWLAITRPLWLSVIISASEDHAIEFLNRVYFIYDRLEEFLQPPIKSRTKQLLEFNHEDGLVSTIKSMPTIEMGAESKTPNRLVIDEAHTIRNVKTIYNSSYPGIEQAKGSVIIIANSVKNGAGWGFVRDTYTASQKAVNKFKRIFLPWMAHPGRPKNFRELMVEQGMNPEDVIEHYPATEAEALAAATGSFFGNDLSKHTHFADGIKGDLVRNKEKEIELQDNKHGIVELWRYPYYMLEGWNKNKWERRYCIGSDVSEGLGGDYSVAYVMDRSIDEIVCRVRSNRIDAHEWANLLYRLSSWYDKALIAVERNGSGITTIKRLEALRANQYVREVPGKIGKSITKEYGWLSTGGANGSKYELCGDLRTWFKNTKSTVYCPILIDEASVFIKYENGTLGAEEGKHDDCVIAAGLTIKASVFVGQPAKEILPPVTGWRGRLQKEKQDGSIWAS